METTLPTLVLRELGEAVPYEATWQAMRQFTAQRDANTPDEIWLLQHPAVYTLGQAGKREHLLCETTIPVIPIDRGGQITYHGPGQVILYPLLDLRRWGLNVRQLVRLLENSVIACLAQYGLSAQGDVNAPGVYVAGAKIAALGLRVRQGCCYHGLSLNVAMDLRPFQAINPCGYAGMAVTQLRDLGVNAPPAQVGQCLAAIFRTQLYAAVLDLKKVTVTS